MVFTNLQLMTLFITISNARTLRLRLCVVLRKWNYCLLIQHTEIRRRHYVLSLKPLKHLMKVLSTIYITKRSNGVIFRFTFVFVLSSNIFVIARANQNFPGCFCFWIFFQLGENELYYNAQEFFNPKEQLKATNIFITQMFELTVTSCISSGAEIK